MDNVSQSKDGFLRSGVTEACLKLVGNVLVCRDRLTILARAGSKVSKQSLSNVVGIGSRLHDFEFPSVMIFFSSIVVTCLNSASLGTLEGAYDTGAETVDGNDCLILSILSLKKWANLLASSVGSS